MIVEAAREARRKGAALAVFPEMSVSGYPPLDLLEHPTFLAAVDRAISWIATSVPGDLGVLVGAPMCNPDPVGKRLFNAAILLDGGGIADRIDKSLLPTYDVYDEYRYFEPAAVRRCMEWRDLRLGVHICEDMWNSDEMAEFRMYGADPLDDLARDGADLFINLSATPFAAGKHAQRNKLVEDICAKYGRPFVIVNQVGANTDLIFDGDSRVHLADGRLALCAPSFEESVLVWDTDEESATDVAPHDDTADIHRALVVGVRDYFRKTDAFSKAVLGVSGGIDSAVAWALATDALGPENVLGVTMPSRYTAESSLEDARLLAANLGAELHEIPIDHPFTAFRDTLAVVNDGSAAGIAEENIQARTRGVILMAISNTLDYLVLSAGNKSETAVGYMTLYGDMIGGIGVLSDVYKTQVYALARFINARAGRPIIPSSVLDKAPSAELRPGQVDQDTLPPYEVLDAILKAYIEDRSDLDAIVEKTGSDRDLVEDVLRRVDRNEFKRRQAPPALRVSDKSFGSGRRMPLAMKWDRSSVTYGNSDT